MSLVKIFVHGLENVELPRATRMLEGGEAPSPARRAYLEEILAWEEVLREEAQAPERADVKKALERPGVKQALAKVRDLALR